MAAVLLVVGALLVLAGTAVLFWPVALIVGGLLCLAAGVDLARPDQPEGNGR